MEPTQDGPARVVVEAVPSTGSTNSDLLDWARSHGSQQRVVMVRVAEEQTAGRGRLGRPWLATSASSLTFSLAMNLNPVRGWGALSLALGYAAAQVLQPWVGHQPEGGSGCLMLKWPNDLWWFDQWPGDPEARSRGRKAAGILIETLPSPTSGRWVVVGMGLNVRVQGLNSTELPEQGVAGTAEWRPQDDAVSLWHELVPALFRGMLAFETHGFEGLREAVQNRDLLTGQPVVLSAGHCRSGVCQGIDDDGALLVKDDAGLHRVLAGEAQVRPAGAGTGTGLQA